jgi:hypothetical protein
MRLWTIQGIEIYEQLKREGIAYCTKPEWGDDDLFVYAYHWMANQMRQRIGEPPINDIEYPMWAWYQYDSAKRNKPPRSPLEVSEGLSAYMEIELPDSEVLLSDFSAWHHVLNQLPLDDYDAISKETGRLVDAAGYHLQFADYDRSLQERIEKSWEAVFDINRRDYVLGKWHRRNRSIQATFWVLKQENLITVEFLKRKGNSIKRILEINSLKMS